MKRIMLILLTVFFLMPMRIFSTPAEEDITGIWAMVDGKTNKPESFILLYMHNGALYGRVIALVELDTGMVADTISSQTVRVENLEGNPPFCGLDFMYSMENTGGEWKGSMITPNGKVFNCSVRPNDSGLRVRISLKALGGLFGQTMTWVRAAPEELPAEIIVPDGTTIFPNMPRGEAE